MVLASPEFLPRKAFLPWPLRQRPPCFVPPATPALLTPTPHLAITDGTGLGMWSTVNEQVTSVNEHITGEPVLVEELP